MRFLASFILALVLTGCADMAQLPFSAGVGPDPVLPPPAASLIPTVHIAPAIGWPEGAQPKAADGRKVTAFARALEHPRWVYVLPNGDVLVAETNAPPRPEDSKGLKGRAMAAVMK
jgi:glucose/arabinose dehydrogenase